MKVRSGVVVIGTPPGATRLSEDDREPWMQPSTAFSDAVSAVRPAPDPFGRSMLHAATPFLTSIRWISVVTPLELTVGAGSAPQLSTRLVLLVTSAAPSSANACMTGLVVFDPTITRSRAVP